ncbi:MAG: chromate transporter [Tissierellia bacterium]|nr:chromate transporter [Tissierellia bacterium]
MIYWELFVEFFKTGLFAIGGGPATIPFLKLMSAEKGWFSQSDLLDMIAISESTPGALGTNMATYVGIKVAGIPGGLVAVTALALPSVLVILIIIQAVNKYRNSPLMRDAFYGIRPSTAGLVGGALLDLYLVTLFRIPAVGVEPGPFAFLRTGSILLFAALYLIHWKKPKLHPIAIIVMGALCGVVFSL